MKRAIQLSVFGLLMSSFLWAGESCCPVSERTAIQSPVGVMGDHIHADGDWMFSYRYHTMMMDTLRNGSDHIAEETVLNDYNIVPQEMDMDMHMLGVMYAPSERFTISAMFPYITKKMKHLTAGGGEFTTRSEGLGDIKVSGLVSIYQSKNVSLHFSSGISFPSGSIDKHDNTLTSTHAKLPYSMQLGSGSWEYLPGITLQGNFNDRLSWGTQLNGVIRLNTNSNDYKLGDEVEISAWLAYLVNQGMSVSTRLQWQKWGHIESVDPDLNAAAVPTADTANSGGDRLDIFAGVNFYITRGFFKDHRISLEVGFPLYQDLNGTQLGIDMQVIAGWQFTF